MENQKHTKLMMDIGRYSLAIFFFIESLTYFIVPEMYISIIPSWLLGSYFWILLFGFIWFLTSTSFFINTWTYVTGTLIALIMLVMAIYDGVVASDSLMLSATILRIGVLIAITGGALIVANQYNDNKNIRFLSRIFIGIFFIIAGCMHFANISSDTTIIHFMPGAAFFVIFTGMCWIAAGLSFWTNIMSRLAALLSVLLILIITLTISIHYFNGNSFMAPLLGIGQNIGLIGCCLLVGANGKYTLK